MRGQWKVVAAVAFASGATTAATVEPCAQVASIVEEFLASDTTGVPAMVPSIALACLESIPISLQRDVAFVDYIEPYIEFQSTLAYLKDPPIGYTLPGVDVLGGLSKIRSNLVQGVYKQQWSFEKDLWTLVNILPHDFHFNLELPLMRLFKFQTSRSLVSISVDGESLPEPYSLNDLKKQYTAASKGVTLPWSPSAVVSINGEPVSDYLQLIAEQFSSFQDPDAFYNLLFPSIPFAVQTEGATWNKGSHTFGFESDFTNYTFANGTELRDANFATTTFSFANVTDGPSLFNAWEVPATTTTETTPTEPSSAPATISLVGYPKPVVIHPQGGYTSGYFLDDGETAVLAMSAFVNPAQDVSGNSLQQKVISKFLAACTANGMKKLIIDLSSNGGGSVFNGVDAFKQLFPQIEPFGASRYRYTDAMNFFGTIYTGADIHNLTFSTEYQTQGQLDVNEQHFDDWEDLAGPVEIHGDKFTNIIRENMTDPVLQIGNGLIISGYLNNTNIPPQPFKSENIVMLYDGTCGSTCAIFSEMMKNQGRVRSVSVGGRPQKGPMQGVGGSKGAQVLTYGSIQQLVGLAPVAAQVYQSKGLTLPTPPDVNLTTQPPPLAVNGAGNRFNLRNNYNDRDTDDAPLQFIYEPANCRLYYQAEDFISQKNLWSRVANATWGNTKCVSGSTTNSDDTIATGPYDTVPFTLDAYSKVNLPEGTVGLLAKNTKTTQSNTTSSSSGATPSTSDESNKKINSAAGITVPSLLGLFGLAIAFVMGMI